MGEGIMVWHVVRGPWAWGKQGSPEVEAALCKPLLQSCKTVLKGGVNSLLLNLAPLRVRKKGYIYIR